MAKAKLVDGNTYSVYWKGEVVDFKVGEEREVKEELATYLSANPQFEVEVKKKTTAKRTTKSSSKSKK